MYQHYPSQPKFLSALLVVLIQSQTCNASIQEIEARIEAIEAELALLKAELKNEAHSKTVIKNADDIQDTASLGFFGSFKTSINQIEDDEAISQNGVSFRDNSSSIGINAEYSNKVLEVYYKSLLTNRTDGIFSGGNAQTKFNFAGVRGEFGDLKIGIVSLPYKLPSLMIDPFYDTSAAALGAQAGKDGSLDGVSFGESLFGMGFSKNAIVYKSPSLGRLTVDVATIIDDDDTDDHGYNLGFTYRSDTFISGLQHHILGGAGTIAFADRDNNDLSFLQGNATRLWMQLIVGDARWGFSAENVDYDTVLLSEDERHYYLSLRYNLNPDWELMASIGDSDKDNPNALEDTRVGQSYTAAAYYNLMPNVRLYGLYAMHNRENALLDDRQIFSLGVDFRFSYTNVFRP